MVTSVGPYDVALVGVNATFDLPPQVYGRLIQAIADELTSGTSDESPLFQAIQGMVTANGGSQLYYYYVGTNMAAPRPADAAGKIVIWATTSTAPTPQPVALQDGDYVWKINTVPVPWSPLVLGSDLQASWVVGTLGSSDGTLGTGGVTPLGNLDDASAYGRDLGPLISASAGAKTYAPYDHDGLNGQPAISFPAVSASEYTAVRTTVANFTTTPAADHCMVVGFAGALGDGSSSGSDETIFSMGGARYAIQRGGNDTFMRIRNTNNTAYLDSGAHTPGNTPHAWLGVWLPDHEYLYEDTRTTPVISNAEGAPVAWTTGTTYYQWGIESPSVTSTTSKRAINMKAAGGFVATPTIASMTNAQIDDMLTYLRSLVGI